MRKDSINRSGGENLMSQAAIAEKQMLVETAKTQFQNALPSL